MLQFTLHPRFVSFENGPFGFPHVVVLYNKRLKVLQDKISDQKADELLLRPLGERTSNVMDSLDAQLLCTWYSNLDKDFGILPSKKEVISGVHCWVEHHVVDVLNRKNVDFLDAWMMHLGKCSWNLQDITDLLVEDIEPDFSEGYIYVYLDCPLCSVAWEAVSNSFSEESLNMLSELFLDEWDCCEFKEETERFKFPENNPIFPTAVFMEGLGLVVSRS